MTLAGFEVFTTMDKSLPKQQNLRKFATTILILQGSNNKFETLQALMPPVLAAIESRPDFGMIEVTK